MATKAKFSFKSTNLWVNILNLALGALAISGVQFSQPTGDTAADIVNTLNSTGVIAVVGLVILNIVSPVYHAAIKNQFNFKALLSSSNFWVQFGAVAVSALMLLGIDIPTGTPDQVVEAVFARDWTGLAFILLSNVMNPLIRFFKELKRKDEETELAA